MEHNSLLQWVVVFDELKHISEFAHLKPVNRPKAVCPECNYPVIMKLGTKTVHHIAHALGNVCPLTAPETAIHFNTKMYIAQVISEAEKMELVISQSCSSCYWNKRNIIWVQNWDDVRVERKIENNLQPDVMLMKNDIPIAAIEVFVTHAVEKEKEEKLKAINLTWIEIKGAQAFYTGDKKWRIDEPLPLHRSDYRFDKAWLCESCIAQQREEEKRKEWQKLNGDNPIEYRLVDFFFPSGKWMRNLYVIACKLENGEEKKFSLERHKTSSNIDRIKYFRDEVELVTTSNLSDRKAAINQIKQRERSSLKKRTSDGVILDSPMPWKVGEPLYFKSYDLRRFPRRFYFNRKTREWFMPKEKKSIKWFS